MSQFVIPVLPGEGGLVLPTAALVTYYLTRSVKTTAQVSAGVFFTAIVINFLGI